MAQIIVIGYGDVGARVARVLLENRAHFLVVDKDEDKLRDKGFKYVVGDGTKEEVLREAGVEEATVILVMLNRDTDVIFATLLARNMNPGATILARANSNKALEKIYRAGADYVASLPIVAGQMIAKIIAAPDTQVETIRLYQGIDIERYTVDEGSPLANKTLDDVDIREKTGCTVIGMQRDHRVTTDIDPHEPIKPDTILAIMGDEQSINRFRELYGE